jgi:hypothetical protein
VFRSLDVPEYRNGLACSRRSISVQEKTRLKRQTRTDTVAQAP